MISVFPDFCISRSFRLLFHTFSFCAGLHFSISRSENEELVLTTLNILSNSHNERSKFHGKLLGASPNRPCRGRTTTYFNCHAELSPHIQTSLLSSAPGTNYTPARGAPSFTSQRVKRPLTSGDNLLLLSPYRRTIYANCK